MVLFSLIQYIMHNIKGLIALRKCFLNSNVESIPHYKDEVAGTGLRVGCDSGKKDLTRAIIGDKGAANGGTNVRAMR